MPSTTRLRALSLTTIVGAVVAAMLTGIALADPRPATARPATAAVPAVPAAAKPAPPATAKPAPPAADRATPAPPAVAPKPVKYVSVRSNIGDTQVYGVGIPVVLTFDKKIPAADRAAVEKRLAVTSTPAQKGTWHWFSDREVHYRPKHYWRAGATIAVDADLKGLALANGYVARNSLSIDAHVTKHPLTVTIDAHKHRLVVTRDGQVVQVMKASLGKKKTPSSSGEMVIMTRSPSEIFDSSLGGGTPVDAPGGYREVAHWTMRLTWGGEFIHAAPWSVESQGHRNVSHGCTNLSDADAKWLYENSHVGDPVTVTGTPRALQSGNGWTDWDMSWSAYKAS